MVAPSKNFTVIPDGDVDPDSPLTTDLMTALRDNDIHLEEWLGDSFVAAKDHDHDGTNSKAVSVAAAAVGQAQLKTTTGEVSTSSGIFVNLTLPGGTYGFYPQIRTTATSMLATIAGTTNFNSSSYTTNIQLRVSSGAGTARAQHRHVQA